MSLSKRLNSCLEYTKGFNRLADIGTDHALLPIEAINRGYVLSALAIDNKKGPFEIAYNNVIEHKLEKSITVILGDGISRIDNDVDVVVISGMGGGLIANILVNYNLKNVKRLVLQPNNDASSIRGILDIIEFHIVDEDIINEKNKLYDLIIIETGIVYYNKLQIEFGPINLKKKSRFFIIRIKNEITRLNNLLNQISLEERKTTIKTRISLLKEALK